MALPNPTEVQWALRSRSSTEHARQREVPRRWQEAESILPQPARPPSIYNQRHRAVEAPLNYLCTNSIPSDCPFSIRPMNDEGSLFLIREKDKYGEYPNIYAKIVSATNQSNAFDVGAATLIVLCDTGCGTDVTLRNIHTRTDSTQHWNIGSFLEATINPQNHLPYLIITSHCHYDHIMGIANLDLARSMVLSSGYDKSFITPRSHLSEHSLCNDLGIAPPKYDISIWAEDLQKVVATLPHSPQPISTGITILQTPGHTPDSLAWYDATLSPPHIFVGDSLYERQSADTKKARWGREPPMATIFNINSDLADWSTSMNKVTDFVKERNEELKTTAAETDDGEWVMISQTPERRTKPPRVLLGAAHVTVSVDAEDCLREMMYFMHRILQDDVPHCRVEDEKEYEVWLWDDLLDVDERVQSGGTWARKGKFGRFSVRAPLFVIDKEREKIRGSGGRSEIEDGDWAVS